MTRFAANLVLFVALILAFELVGAPTIAASAPIPAYASHVSKTEHVSARSSLIYTSDAADQVIAWYRKNLPTGTREVTRPSGGHMFLLAGGGVVDVTPGNRFAPDTKIGVQTPP